MKDLLDEKKYTDLGADVNYQHNQDFTPLHYAALGQSLELIQVLIEKLAEINART